MENGKLGMKAENYEVYNITKRIWKMALGKNGLKTVNRKLR